ncbi:MAG: hypothetical protein C0608_02980 [Deltaproteobacteria bacterium]|nr:MAG: hypothetical protein C0608_02980 [Deltaproteobacteria bacterium]
MKCPKCGYTSFDYLDECKKCGADISDTRAMLGVIAVSPEERAQTTPASSGAEAASQGIDFNAEDILGGDDGSLFVDEPDLGALDDDAGEGDGLFVERTSLEKSDSANAGDDDKVPGLDNFSFGDESGKKQEKKSTIEEEEDEFLNMDFSDVFSDDE